MKNTRFAFTLVELILVVSMVVILTVIGTSSYIKPKNKALSREAVSNLKLIAAAERIYKMEDNSNAYVACASFSDCNDKLNLFLNGTNWSYSVTANGTPEGVATIIATRPPTGDPVCSYSFDSGIGGVGFDSEPPPPTGPGC